MKHPNDTKRPNSNSGSVGRFMRMREELVHVAARAGMMLNPAIAEAAKKGAVFTGPRMVPWRTPKGQGDTFSVGRNHDKRVRRAMRPLPAMVAHALA